MTQLKDKGQEHFSCFLQLTCEGLHLWPQPVFIGQEIGKPGKSKAIEIDSSSVFFLIVRLCCPFTQIQGRSFKEVCYVLPLYFQQVHALQKALPQSQMLEYTQSYDMLLPTTPECVDG